MSHIITSDLHLKNDYSQFKNFCENIAINYDNLFILGDLFDLYLGDDLIDKYYLEVINILKELSTKTNIFIMHGNRDFLIGKDFGKKSGAKLIKEPYILDNFVLMHGDYLVRDDRSYRVFKFFIQNKLSKFILNNLAKKFREKLAIKIQAKSKKSKYNKPLEIMDVNDEFTDKFMQKYPQKDLIHGHTHRHKTHQRKTYIRYVLASWDNYDNTLQALIIKNNTIENIKIP